MTEIVRRRFIQGAGGAVAGGALVSCGGGGNAAVDGGWIDAVETAARIKQGDLTAVEAVGAAIARAEAADPQINAIVTPTFDEARAAAAAATPGPFSGVPTFVKDLTDVAGQPTRYGSRAYANYVADGQPPFVDKLFECGVISLGKSSTPEFGATATTEPLLHGPTRNPWNLDHSTGGSSGGAAALVAAGVVPMAHASDGGGSIRIPASCCGLVGLKPSRGRTPAVSVSDPPPLLLSVHAVVARTMRDAAAFHAAMELGDGEGALAPTGLIARPTQTRRKIGFFTEGLGGATPHADVIAAVTDAASVCADLGHNVEEVAAPFSGAPSDDFLIYWAAGVADTVARWEEAAGRRAGYDDFEPLTFGLIQHYEANKSIFERAVERLLQYEEIYLRAFEDFDVILSPVLATPPPPIGWLRPDLPWDTAVERVGDYVQYTQIHNIAGAPAISLPLGMSSEGLPIGAMFAGKPGDEGALLALGFELEIARPWIARRPPLFVGDGA
ncbi:MAG: amidase [Pseudomonadota bacterium]